MQDFPTAENIFLKIAFHWNYRIPPYFFYSLSKEKKIYSFSGFAFY